MNLRIFFAVKKVRDEAQDEEEQISQYVKIWTVTILQAKSDQENLRFSQGVFLRNFENFLSRRTTDSEAIKIKEALNDCYLLHFSTRRYWLDVQEPDEAKQTWESSDLLKGPVKLIKRVKIAHSFLQSVSDKFYVIVLSLPI